MALSGSFTGTTNNQYIQPRISWYAKQDYATQTSTITAVLSYTRTNTGYKTWGEWHGGVTVNGTTIHGGQTNISQGEDAIQYGKWRDVCSFENYVIHHDSDGNASFVLGGYGHLSSGTLKSTTISQRIYLDRIPVAAKITSLQLNSKTETSATFSWEADTACDKIQYKINGSEWQKPSGHYPLFTVSGLSKYTNYTLQLRGHRNGSGEEGWSSGGGIKSINFTTYDYPYVPQSYMKTIKIGTTEHLDIYNPLNRQITSVGIFNSEIKKNDSKDPKSYDSSSLPNPFYLENTYFTNGEITIPGVDFNINLATQLKDWFYKSIPTKQSGAYSIWVESTISTEVSSANQPGKGTFQIDQQDCQPILTLSQDSITDINLDTTNLTKNNKKMIKYKSVAEIKNISTLAKNFATIESCTCSNGYAKISLTAENPSGQFATVTTGQFIFTVKDSRGVIFTHVENLPFVEYIIPSCYIENLKDLIVVDGKGQLKGELSGTGFNTSAFDDAGTIKNALIVEYKIATPDQPDLVPWTEITPKINWSEALINGVFTHSFAIESAEVHNLTHPYQLTMRIKDSLYLEGINSNSVQTRAIPIFDWNDKNFNFNVPVLFQGQPMKDFIIEENQESVLILDNPSAPETSTFSVKGTWYWQKWSSGWIDCFFTGRLRYSQYHEEHPKDPNPIASGVEGLSAECRSIPLPQRIVFAGDLFNKPTVFSNIEWHRSEWSTAEWREGGDILIRLFGNTPLFVDNVYKNKETFLTSVYVRGREQNKNKENGGSNK